MWVITRVFFSFLILFFALPAHASVVFPSAVDVQVMPGESKQIEIGVKNTEVTDRSYTVEIVGVDLGQEEGDYSFYNLDENKRSWFSIVDSQFSLVSQEERTVDIEFLPSQDAFSETFVVGVQIIEEPVDQDQISVRTGIMSLIFITLGDDVPYDVQWTDFQISSDIFTGEVNSYLTIKNIDKGTLQPDGVIQVKNIFGRISDESILNPELKRIPEDQVRTLPVNQFLPWAVGPYKLSLYVQPWQNAEVFTVSKTVWFCSWRVISVISAILLLFILIWSYARRA